MKQANSADCQIPQTVADFCSQVHPANTKLVTYLYITSPKSKKMQIFSLLETHSTEQRGKTAKLLLLPFKLSHTHILGQCVHGKLLGCTTLDQEGDLTAQYRECSSFLFTLAHFVFCAI